jgi:hypothetical protein
MKRWIAMLGVLALGFTGCVSPQTRAQSADETEREKDLAVRSIGDVTEVANANKIQVSGIGLVTGLDGTGHSPKGIYRSMLEQQLRKDKVENIKALLDSPNSCLVLVTAFLPPGCRRGDVLDVEVTLPPGSKATSLKGGYLQDCYLRDYDLKKNVSPTYTGSDGLLTGIVRAHARGPLLVGIGSPDEAAQLRQARIWGGGISNFERPFYLTMKNDSKSSRIASAVAEKLNLQFQDDLRLQRMIQQHQRLVILDEVTQQLNQKQEQGLAQGEMAKAINKEMINLRVPYTYRYNAERYLRVARLIPLYEEPDHKGKYRSRLQKMLLDPSDTLGIFRAALRLEALGKESIPALKRGLESDHYLVRFASAEALAYLESTTGVDELARLAEEQPNLRLYCMIALSSLDEGICRTKLSEMLTKDDAALRCGAFRSLRLLDESPQRLARDLGGEMLGDSFWLHQVAPKSTRLVFFAMAKKAEIVLFGENIQLTPVKVMAGNEFAVTVEQGDDCCTISRITVQNGVKRAQCTLALDDVLRTMAKLGAGYPEAVDLLRKLDDRQALNCPVAANTLPAQVTLEELAEQNRVATRP